MPPISRWTLLAGATEGLLVGPLLLGVAKPVHVMVPSVTARGIVNMTALPSPRQIAPAAKTRRRPKMELQSLFDQAMQMHKQGRLADAEPLYLQVLQTAPGTAGAHYLLGMLKAQQGRMTEALEGYERALALRPDFTEAQYNHGVLLWQMRRPADALRSYDKVLKALPRNAEAHYNRGVVLAELTRFEEAVVSYDAALAIQPDFVRRRGQSRLGAVGTEAA